MLCATSMSLRLCGVRRSTNKTKYEVLTQLSFRESLNVFCRCSSAAPMGRCGNRSESIATTSSVRFASSFHSKRRPLGSVAERTRLASITSASSLGLGISDERHQPSGSLGNRRQQPEKIQAATDAVRQAIASCSSSSAASEAAELLLATDRKKLYAVHRPTNGLSPADYILLLEKLRHHHDGGYARRVFALVAELLEKPLHPQAGGGTPWDVGDAFEWTARALALAMGSMSPSHALEFADEYFQLPVTLLDDGEKVDGGGAHSHAHANSAVVSAVFAALKVNVAAQPSESYPPRGRQAEMRERDRRSGLLTSPGVIAGVTAALIRERTPSSVSTALELLDLAAKARLRGIACFTEEVATEAAEAAATVGDVEVVTRVAFLLYRAMGALGSSDHSSLRESEVPRSSGVGGGARSKRNAVDPETSAALKNVSSSLEKSAAPAHTSASSPSVASAVWSLWSHIGSAPATAESDVGSPTRSRKGNPRGGSLDPDAAASFELAVVRLLKSVMHASLFNPHHRQPGADMMAADAAALQESHKLFCGLLRGSSLEAMAAMAMELLGFVADRPWLSLLTVRSIVSDLQRHAARLHRGGLSGSQQVLVSHCLRRALECHMSFLTIGTNEAGSVPLRFPIVIEKNDSTAAMSAKWVLDTFAALPTLTRTSASVVSLALAATCTLGDARRALGLVEDYIAANKNASRIGDGADAVLRCLSDTNEERIVAALLLDSTLRGEDDPARCDPSSSFTRFPASFASNTLFSCASGAQLNVLLEELSFRSDYPSPNTIERLAEAFRSVLPHLKDSHRSITRMVAILAHQRCHVDNHMPQTRRTLDLLYTLLSGLSVVTALTPAEVATHLQQMRERSVSLPIVVVDASVVQHAIDANRSLTDMMSDVFGSSSAIIHYVLPWNTLVALSEASCECASFHHGRISNQVSNHTASLGSCRFVDRNELNADSLVRLVELGQASALVPLPATFPVASSTQDRVSAASTSIWAGGDSARSSDEGFASLAAALAISVSVRSVNGSTVSLWVEEETVHNDPLETRNTIANECRTHAIELVSLRRAQTKRASAALRHILPLPRGKPSRSGMTAAPQHSHQFDPPRTSTATRELLLDRVQTPPRQPVQQTPPTQVKFPSR